MKYKKIVVFIVVILILIGVFKFFIKNRTISSDNREEKSAPEITYKYDTVTGMYTLYDENGKDFMQVRDKSELDLYLNSDYRATPPEPERDETQIEE